MDYFDGGSGNDSHVGSTGDDTLYGNGGNDTLVGLGGRDYIFGGDGNDSLDGGDGNDFLGASTGADTLVGGAGDDTLSGSGGVERDRFDGGLGNDQVSGSIGDTLIGGAGVDEFQLYLDLSTASETIDFGRLLTGATLKLSGGTQLSGFEAGWLVLGSGSDHVALGDTGTFSVLTGAGADTVIGGNGDDWMEGGSGDDSLVGGAGNDTVGFGSSARGVRVSLALTGIQNTGDGRDFLSGFERVFGSTHVDRIIGNSTDNYLWGNGGYDIDADTGDTITGGAGDDTIAAGGAYSVLTGGSGDDQLALNDFMSRAGAYQTLIGGKGQDTLFLTTGSTAVFESVRDSTVAHPDHVNASNLTYDRFIDLHLIDADETKAGDQAFTLVDRFGRHPGELTVTAHLLEGGSYETWVLMDTDGDGRPEAKIVIYGDHHNFHTFVL